MVSRYSEVERCDAEVIAVAVTPAFSQLAFATHIGAPFPMVWDWRGDVCAAYGVRYDEWKGHSGVAKRAVFVIGTDMAVHYAWSDDDAERLPDLDPAFETLRRRAVPD